MGSGAISEPKIGSERGARNVEDCNYKNISIPFSSSRLGSGAFSEPNIGSARGAGNGWGLNNKRSIDSMNFLPFGLAISEPKIKSERGAGNVYDFNIKNILIP